MKFPAFPEKLLLFLVILHVHCFWKTALLKIQNISEQYKAFYIYTVSHRLYFLILQVTSRLLSGTFLYIPLTFVLGCIPQFIFVVVWLNLIIFKFLSSMLNCLHRKSYGTMNYIYLYIHIYWYLWSIFFNIYLLFQFLLETVIHV